MKMLFEDNQSYLIQHDGMNFLISKDGINKKSGTIGVYHATNMAGEVVFCPVYYHSVYGYGIVKFIESGGLDE